MTVSATSRLIERQTDHVELFTLDQWRGLRVSPARVMGPLVCHEHGTGSFRLLAVC
jgi:hypothetical protein